jgi:glycosyltransferase involved in cell wall biosynthesis
MALKKARPIMSKIKVVHNAKYCDYAGTSRVAQTFVEHLNRDPRFEAYLVYQEGPHNSRLDACKQLIGEKFLVPYKWVHQRNARPPYYPAEENLTSVLFGLEPNIVHVHRSGYDEAFGHKAYMPEALFVETNIFGYSDGTGNIDKHLYICDYIRRTAVFKGNPDGPIVYNPIEDYVMPDARERLLNRFNLPKNAILLGRVGRPDNFSPISLKALKIVQETYNNVHYIVVGPCPQWYAESEALDLRNMIFVQPTSNDDLLREIYCGIDIYCHARSDGDVTSTAIAQAMMAGKPCISHVGHSYNGQAEMLDKAGILVGEHDFPLYAASICKLIENGEIYSGISIAARQKALELYEAGKVTDQLKNIYLEMLR